MAFWPFGRKSKSKKAKTDGEKMGLANRTTQSLMRDPRSEIMDPMLSSTSGRTGSQRRPRSSSRKLAKKIRESDNSFPPLPTGPMADRHDPLDEKLLTSATTIPNQQLSKAPKDRGDVPSYYFHNQISCSSLQPESFSIIPPVPTLSTKRSANDKVLPRQKSSKRKADDHAREQEIKALSSPIPIPKRPISGASGLFARDNKKIPGGMNRNLERPISDVSLPIPESIASSMSMAYDSHGFKVSSFDILSPRPTIRYSENPRFASGSGSLQPSRASTRKDKQPMNLETVKSRKRIHELAHDMDASSLRELMDRDRRRSEKYRKNDDEKLQRRLHKKAEKQRARERKEDLDVGLGDEKIPPISIPQNLHTAATQMKDGTTSQSWLKDPEREHSPKTPESWLKDPSREHLESGDPFHDPIAGPGTSHLEAPTPIDERDEPVVQTAKAVRLSQASLSPPTSPTPQAQEPSTFSQIAFLASRSTPDIPERGEAERRDSDTSARLSSNWKTIFRRSGTRADRHSADRGRTTPSEFSNTSRESFARQIPPSAFTKVPRARSGTPVRTQSKFREDLPELPISPPDSRVQSPELPGQHTSSRADQIAAAITSDPSQSLSDIHPAFREEIALSRHQSMNKGSPDGPSSAVLSQSLASVDSEGSWLTGRPVKRLSQTHSNPLRESASSLQQRLRNLGASEEDLKIAENKREHEDQLTPEPERTSSNRRIIRHQRQAGQSNTIGESDDDTAIHPSAVSIAPEEGTWHGAIGKQPTIVRHGARARSREGLLNDFQAADSLETSPTESSPVGESPVEATSSPDTPFIQRATSVDFGKGHARHISAGSARLLNLPARSSGEGKRMSSASGERSPLGPPSPHQPEETRASDVD